uniref:RNA binding motif protein 45 n=1 Tax=Eptatretus burgeri TaxID=7764 RepID=A0A8C4Q765_EPTBU
IFFLGSCVHGGYRGYVNLHEPPNSRLFLVVSRSTTERELREMFDKFGEIQDILSVKDKFTKEAKGVAYVKYGKSSQACRAMEELNGKSLSDGKPMKVLIAQSRSSSCGRDVEDEDLTRIFVMIPKSFTEEDLKSNFQEFGDIEYCRIQRDKVSGEGKGYGYVRYMRPSQAALAIENSDRSQTSSFSGDLDVGRHAGPPSSNQLSNHLPGITRCLSVAMNPSITRDQLTAIFRLIPGLDFCDAQKDVFNGLGYIRYNNPASAIYAKEKLNRFEYPPGSPLIVNFVEDVYSTLLQPQFFDAPFENSSSPPSLPPRQPLAPPDSPMKERLFIVCSNIPPPLDVLHDVFCRFGNLIEIYMLSNKCYGYAKYADELSAKAAIEVLNGQEICGVKLKVLPADPPKDEARKRQRTF